MSLDRVAGYLERLGQRRLFAAVGAFLEREAARLFVPPEFLDRLARERPTSPTYLVRAGKGGQLLQRWNLVVPSQWTTEGSRLEV